MSPLEDGRLRVLGGHLVLEVLLAVEHAVRLGVVVQFKRHAARLALEAELVERDAARLDPLLRVHSLSADAALLAAAEFGRHSVCCCEGRKETGRLKVIFGS